MHPAARAGRDGEPPPRDLAARAGVQVRQEPARRVPAAGGEVAAVQRPVAGPVGAAGGLERRGQDAGRVSRREEEEQEGEGGLGGFVDFHAGV